jgi:hypothetical protein
MRSQLKKAFNNQLLNYLTELSKLFPEETDIKLYIQHINTVNNLCPSLIYKFFDEHIGPFREYCNTRNEVFFMGLKYDESVGGNNESMMKAIHFKKLWTVMDTTSKEHTWKQFKILFMLLDKILETKENKTQHKKNVY